MGKHRKLEDQMTWEIPVSTDEGGMTGRECPIQVCLGYFKVKFGTGLKGEDLPCVCPYCGHKGSHDTFWTQDQLGYAESIALAEVTDLVVDELRKSEFDVRGPFGMTLSMRVESGPSPPIRHYREKELETVVTCDSCTLEYAIYGVFGHCPDCGVRNSRQILEKNLELARKELVLSDSADSELKTHLIEDALENAVSAFDGFGREIVSFHKASAALPNQAEKLSFQNLTNANADVYTQFGLKLEDGVDASEWTLLVRCFQKRHLLAHKMGVIDDKYTTSANDPRAVVGRKVLIKKDEVQDLLDAVSKLGKHMADSLVSAKAI